MNIFFLCFSLIQNDKILQSGMSFDMLIILHTFLWSNSCIKTKNFSYLCLAIRFANNFMNCFKISSAFFFFIILYWNSLTLFSTLDFGKYWLTILLLHNSFRLFFNFFYLFDLISHCMTASMFFISRDETMQLSLCVWVWKKNSIFFSIKWKIQLNDNNNLEYIKVECIALGRMKEMKWRQCYEWKKKNLNRNESHSIWNDLQWTAIVFCEHPAFAPGRCTTQKPIKDLKFPLFTCYVSCW